MRSYLAVPVIAREGSVHGGLFFGHSTPGVFTHRDELIVGGIACAGRHRDGQRAPVPREPAGARRAAQAQRGARAARRRPHQRSAPLGAAVQGAGQRRRRLRDLHARHRGLHRQLERRRRAHQGLLAQRGDRQALLDVLHAGGSREGRAAACADDRGDARQVRSRGLARAQGRQSLLGERRDRRDLQRERRASSASPRSRAT